MSKAELTDAKIQEMRRRVWSEQSGLCFWCGKPMYFTDYRGDPLRMELSHRIGQGKTNMKLWGERVIHHRKNIRGCHPGECNRKVSLNPDSLQAEDLVREIYRDLLREKKRAWR